MKSTTILVKPSWGQTLALLEEKKSIRILKTDGEKFKNILEAAGYTYKCSDESFGEFERFTLTPNKNKGDTKTVLDKFVAELKEDRNILNEDDYAKSHQDGWHFWNYHDRSNTSEKYQIRLSKLWSMAGRDSINSKLKASQIDTAIIQKAKEYGLNIQLVDSKVSMADPDRSMYNAEIRLI